MTPVGSLSAHAGGVARLTALSEEIAALRGQVALARRVVAPSDDPIAHARAAALRRAEAASTAQDRALAAANARLDASDLALADLSALAMRARDLALEGANGATGEVSRRLLAHEVRELAAAARGLAATRTATGEPLFAGAAPALGPADWTGSGAAPAVDAGGTLLSAGVTGAEAFGENRTVTDPATGTITQARDLFASLDRLAAMLDDGDPVVRGPGLDTAIGEIDGHIDRLLAARATVGARGARLADHTEQLARTRLVGKAELSGLEDLDMAEALARLQRLMTVLEAAQASFARTASLSLWDQLR